MSRRPDKPGFHPIAWFRGSLQQAPIYPVLVLAGLNLFDELDNAAYGLFGPDITREFGISAATFGWAFVPASILGIILPIVVGYLTDRFNRVALAVAGGLVWFVSAILTGLVGLFWLLVVVRMTALVGRSVSGPVHNSLLSDYYPMAGRGAAFSTHQNSQYFGSFVGLIAGGAIAAAWGWQASFLILPLPGLIFVLLLLRLREPVRGHYERLASGQTFDDSAPPGMFQALSLMNNIKSWRRYAFCWLFLAAGLAMTTILSFYFEAVYGIGPFGRGVILGMVMLLTIVGAMIGGVIAQRAMAAGRGDRAGRLIVWATASSAVALVGVAVAPTLWAAVLILLFTTPLRAMAAVPVLLILSATVPTRIRGQAFGLLGVYFSIGLLFLPIGLQFGDSYSYRVSLLLGAPAMLIAALFAWSAMRYVDPDTKRANLISSSVMAVRERKAAGEQIDLLEISGLDVGYGSVQVLYDVNLRVGEGEMVALLGTNGAGKSTLLRAMSGLVKPSDGMVLFDGEDVTGLDAEMTTARGIVHVPGGRGVFPGLTVERNLRLGTYLFRKDAQYSRQALDRALDMFPRLGERLNQPAGALSGGEQQMVALAQAFMAKPRLIAIDELSLGLAPKIVEELLETVRRINASGVSVIVVEQSVNIALTLTQRAYFMEKGRVRFEGASRELLERDDLVRSVFLADPARDGVVQ